MKENYTKAKMSIIIEENDADGWKNVFGFADYYNTDGEIGGEIDVGGSSSTPPTIPDD